MIATEGWVAALHQTESTFFSFFCDFFSVCQTAAEIYRQHHLRSHQPLFAIVCFVISTWNTHKGGTLWMINVKHYCKFVKANGLLSPLSQRPGFRSCRWALLWCPPLFHEGFVLHRRTFITRMHWGDWRKGFWDAGVAFFGYRPPLADTPLPQRPSCGFPEKYLKLPVLHTLESLLLQVRSIVCSHWKWFKFQSALVHNSVAHTG